MEPVSLTKVRGGVISPSDGFTQLYRNEIRQQVQRATFLLGSNEQANDVVHDAFTEVFGRWDEIENPGAYLQTSVLNRCRDARRRSATRRRFVDRLRPHTPPNELEYLTDALAKLPFNHRAAVVHHFFAGMTQNEIADALNCAPGSIGPWLQRGLESLRKELS